MQLTIYQLDAFSSKVFGGNPAAVCPLTEWLPDSLMQQIALENNLAETAFYVKEGSQFHIRWFTPAVEVDLCGHATLATAFVIFNFEGYTDAIIEFTSKSGILKVQKQGDLLELDFPVDELTTTQTPEALVSSLGITPIACFKGKTDYMLVLENEEQVKNLKPDFRLMATVPARGVIVTAQGNDVDFVSRFFGPQCGIDEDPVTGSAHTTLIPYWAKTLDKNDLVALQVSPRQGQLWCTLADNRVKIAGNVTLYLKGIIEI